MATSIALTTHGWPVTVVTTDSYANANGTSVVTVTTERVERWQIRQLVVTDTRSIAINELTSEGWQDNPNDSAAKASSEPVGNDLFPDTVPPAGTPLTAEEIAANSTPCDRADVPAPAPS